MKIQVFGFSQTFSIDDANYALIPIKAFLTTHLYPFEVKKSLFIYRNNCVITKLSYKKKELTLANVGNNYRVQFLIDYLLEEIDPSQTQLVTINFTDDIDNLLSSNINLKQLQGTLITLKDGKRFLFGRKEILNKLPHEVIVFGDELFPVENRVDKLHTLEGKIKLIGKLTDNSFVPLTRKFTKTLTENLNFFLEIEGSWAIFHTYPSKFYFGKITNNTYYFISLNSNKVEKVKLDKNLLLFSKFLRIQKQVFIDVKTDSYLKDIPGSASIYRISAEEPIPRIDSRYHKEEVDIPDIFPSGLHSELCNIFPRIASYRICKNRN